MTGTELIGRVAIVTGAAMGIGRSVAETLVGEGASVVLADIDEQAGEATTKALRERGSQAIFVHTDVAKMADMENMARTAVKAFGGVDILVNNAARAIGGVVDEIDEENWNTVISTNLSSVWRGMRVCVPEMRKRGKGSIVNMSSVQALTGFKGWAAYAAAKGGINALTQEAAIDLAPLGIRVNAIAPGTIMTPLNEKIFATHPDPTGLIETWNKAHPLGRFGQPKEVAEAVLFLASDRASFIRVRSCGWMEDWSYEASERRRDDKAMKQPHFHTLEAEGIRAVLDLRVGHVRSLDIAQAGRTIEPLHTAPWIDDPAIIEDATIDEGLRLLSGDFFCAPFGASDLYDAPPHGWSANAAWKLIEGGQRRAGQVVARYELGRTILGAKLIKEFSLRDDHPFLYERHIFVGGKGALPVANHAMTRFDAPGSLSFSPKLFAETPETALEPDLARGRSKLRYPARFSDLTSAPMADGGLADLTCYPIASVHEDFLSLIENPENPLGWAAALRPDKRDIFITLKNPKDFPITMMWFSNGGRDYAPWSGRHRGVLGLEEGRTYAGHGHKASIADNSWTRQGIATALALDPNGEVEVRNVIGGVALQEGWSKVVSVVAERSRLTIVDREGGSLSAPFDNAFLQTGR